MSDETPEDERGSSAEEAEKPLPSRPRGRKKRRIEAEAEPAKGDEATAEAQPEQPAFARDFPRDPALDALVAAFEAGDYGRVRREAPALAKSTDRDDVRAAARELRRRLDPDPLAVKMLGIAALLLVVLASYYWLHPHTP